ncbi:MTP-1 family protein [Jeotgalibacillus campisalis]|uniref:DUF1861 family protein n=1 Tax=Jeotgalibacillus campisalis TaxID=220754 RepID=A0A0C2VF38_9BACL|nr:DUF1861 family protein [Jeotgalibacillus campisalis]KIL43141.1 hypothetical protein KR50_35440 [Jeotgalibacillus campisalis]
MSTTVKTCAVLLEEFRKKEQPTHPKKLLFSGVENRDLYNIAAPFEDAGESVIAGRVEARDSEESEVYFFVERDGEWVPRKNASVLKLQDPFWTRIAGELVLGGVETFPHPTLENALGWRTVFYKGTSVDELKAFASGPDGMKDLRLVELKEGAIGVLTRPQGDKGGRGKIGFTVISSLDELTHKVIEEAPLLEGQFAEGEWGGANEVHVLSNGLLGVLGHIASFDEEGNRHYYPMIFCLDPQTNQTTEIELIAARSNFLEGAAKRPDLVDVVFSGGLVRLTNGSAQLFVGTSDAEAQQILIPDPFLPYERKDRII